MTVNRRAEGGERADPPPLAFWAGFCAILMVAAALRFARIGASDLWIDEAYSLWFARHSLQELWTVIPTFEFHPPVYYSILRAWRVFGESEAALRSLSAFASVGAVAFATLAVLRLLQGKAGARTTTLVSGALLAIAPFQIFHAQDARPYALLCLSVSLLMFAGARLVSAGERARAPFWKSLGLWLPVTAALALPPWMHYMGAVPCLAFGLFLLAAWVFDHEANPRFLINAVAAGCLALLLYSPQLAVMLDRTADWTAATWTTRPEPWWVLRDLQTLYAVPTPYLPVWAGRVLLMLFVLAAVIGAVRLWRMDRRSAAVLLVALAALPPLLIIAISVVRTPIFVVRVVSPSQLGFAPLLALAIMAPPRPIHRALACAAILAITAPSTVMEIGRSKEPWRAVAAQLTREVRPGDLVLVAPNEALLPLEYYYRPAAVVAPPVAVPAPFPAIGYDAPYPAGNIATPGVDEAIAQAAARQAAAYPGRVFLITRNIVVFDPDSLLETALAKRRPRQALTNHWVLRVVTYGPSRPPSPGDP